MIIKEEWVTYQRIPEEITESKCRLFDFIFKDKLDYRINGWSARWLTKGVKEIYNIIVQFSSSWGDTSTFWWISLLKSVKKCQAYDSNPGYWDIYTNIYTSKLKDTLYIDGRN